VKNNSESSGTNLKTRLTLKRDFKKKDRKLVATYRFTYDDNKSNGKLYSLNDNGLNTAFNDTIDQQKDNNSLSLSHTASAIYTEPLNAKFKLEFDYEMFSNQNNQSKKTFNFDNGNYETADLNFTNEFESNKMQNRIGSSIIYDHKKNRFVGGVRFRNVEISNKNLITDTTILQSVNNFLPRFKYTHKFSQTNRFVANYSTSSSQPTVNQLQPVRDNTNPNRISLGNPNLKPNYVHNAFISYNSYKPVSGRYIWSRLSQTITQNAFTSSVDFDAFGRTSTKTVNTNGNAYTNLSFGGGFPVYKQIVTLNPDLNAGYSKFNNFVNGEKNITVNKSIGGGLDVTYETDSLEFSLAGTVSYTDPKSSISASSSQPYYTQSYNADLTVKLPWKFGIESDARYTINSGRAAGYNLNYLIWNATVTKTFGKLENLILGVTVYDILNQNTSAGRDVNANVITDSQTNIIARYLLVKLTLKFNSAKIKENEESHF
jgi:outer membrane receptor protein involved in Fe transport